MGRRSTQARWATGVALGALVVTGCGGSEEPAEGSKELTWYINPDGGGNNPNGGGQAQIARQCSEASDGAYTIRTELLPNSASDQRVQLLRRVAAGDPGVDIMSMDPVFVAEFANAGTSPPERASCASTRPAADAVSTVSLATGPSTRATTSDRYS